MALTSPMTRRRFAGSPPCKVSAQLRAFATTGNRRLRGIPVLLALTSATVFVGSACVPPPPPPPPPRVVVYGDSIVSQSRRLLNQRLQRELPGWEIVNRDFPGTAQCDWNDKMHQDRNLNAKIVVFAFVGNIRPCLDGEAYRASGNPYDAYREDIIEDYRFWSQSGVKVLLVSGPERVGVVKGTRTVPQAYADVAAALGAPLADAGRFLRSPVGVYTPTGPCLQQEVQSGKCRNGVIAIRSADRTHLCDDPDPGPGRWSCPENTPGVVRYVDPIVRGVVGLAGKRGGPGLVWATPPTTSTTSTTTVVNDTTG